MKTGNKDQKKDVMEHIEKLAVGGIKTLNEKIRITKEIIEWVCL